MKTIRSILVMILIGAICSSVAVARENLRQRESVPRESNGDLSGSLSLPEATPFGGKTYLNTGTGAFGGNTLLNTELVYPVTPSYSPHLPDYYPNPHLGDYRTSGRGFVSSRPTRRSRSRHDRRDDRDHRGRSHGRTTAVPVVIVPTQSYSSVPLNTIHADLDSFSFTLSW